MSGEAEKDTTHCYEGLCKSNELAKIGRKGRKMYVSLRGWNGASFCLGAVGQEMKRLFTPD